MPYAVSFTRPVVIAAREHYINECCVGGDIVLERLLPALRDRYGDLQSNQEDWGWYAWFEHDGIKLAVDIFTNDEQTGRFQLHLTSRLPRLLLGAKVHDTPELDTLRDLVVGELGVWPVGALQVARVDENYAAIDEAAPVPPRQP
jgi:hypothetical protein